MQLLLDWLLCTDPTGVNFTGGMKLLPLVLTRSVAIGISCPSMSYLRPSLLEESSPVLSSITFFWLF